MEELGAVSANELHAFLSARYRARVPERAPDVVAALHLDMRATLGRLVQEHQLQVCREIAHELGAPLRLRVWQGSRVSDYFSPAMYRSRTWRCAALQPRSWSAPRA